MLCQTKAGLDSTASKLHTIDTLEYMFVVTP